MPTLDQQALRERINQENLLLNSRTTIFLATNGLWLAAMGWGGLGRLRALIVVVGLLISAVWFICGRQSRNVIAELTRLYLREFPDDPIEGVVRSALYRDGLLSPTDLLGWELPLVFIASWLILVAWTIKVYSI